VTHLTITCLRHDTCGGRRSRPDGQRHRHEGPRRYGDGHDGGDPTVFAAATATETSLSTGHRRPSITASNSAAPKAILSLHHRGGAGGDTTDVRNPVESQHQRRSRIGTEPRHPDAPASGRYAGGISGLTLTPSAHYNGTINLHISVTDTEGATLNRPRLVIREDPVGQQRDSDENITSPSAPIEPATVGRTTSG